MSSLPQKTIERHMFPEMLEGTTVKLSWRVECNACQCHEPDIMFSRSHCTQGRRRVMPSSCISNSQYIDMIIDF